jgi:hypothetical protein
MASMFILEKSRGHDVARSVSVKMRYGAMDGF